MDASNAMPAKSAVFSLLHACVTCNMRGYKAVVIITNQCQILHALLIQGITCNNLQALASYLQWT